jgi:hypothetical protein
MGSPRRPSQHDHLTPSGWPAYQSAGRPTADAVGKPTDLDACPPAADAATVTTSAGSPTNAPASQNTPNTRPLLDALEATPVYGQSSESRAYNESRPAASPARFQTHSAALDASRAASRYREYPNPAAPT